MAWPRGRLAVVGAIAALVSGCGSPVHGNDPSQAVPARTVALQSVQRFLADYVSPSGRVIRHDQGGDTVSEGQGYALLLAYASDNRTMFGRVWHWTQTQLQRPDGLFSYHWQGGQVVDTEPAADADTQIAWALDLAGSRWSVSSYTSQARKVAISIASNEMGYDDQGHPTLAAGPWALSSGGPTQVEPGYWTFPAYAALAALTHDHRWQSLAASDAAHLSAVSRGGAELAPDWATLGNGQSPHASPSPQTNAPPVAGQDGLRSMVWAACLPATHTLDDRWWRLIASTASTGPLSRNLNGQPADSNPSPLSLVAAAAAAGTAGHSGTEGALLSDANTVADRYPTYYGAAWDALGHVLLTTTLIPGCS